MDYLDEKKKKSFWLPLFYFQCVPTATEEEAIYCPTGKNRNTDKIQKKPQFHALMPYKS